MFSGNLTIFQQPEEENVKTGELIVDQVDNDFAGIGGEDNETGGMITINGGTVNAKGGDQAAGIGGGACASGVGEYEGWITK